MFSTARLITCLFLLLLNLSLLAQGESKPYRELKDKLAKGWNTWSYGSMLTHVLLPSGLTIKVNFRISTIGTPYDPDYFLEDVTVDKSGRVHPIAHTFDGSYTELTIDNWNGNSMRIQSAAQGENIVILISPIRNSPNIPFDIELQSGMMWNREGNIKRNGSTIEAVVKEKQFTIRSTGQNIEVSHGYTSPHLVFKGDSTIGFYTGEKKSLGQIAEIIDHAKQSYNQYALKFGDMAEAFQVTQSVLGWNTIYDADKNRVITPVTRGWNEAWQGFVLFEWDTYFAAFLFALDNKEMAYSNIIAVTRLNRQGAVGFTQMPRERSSEQSQPPIGSMICWMIYEKYHDKWLLEEVYSELLSWNRWWIKNRLNNHYLTWGAPWKNAELKHVVLESGLDNSPMYEDVQLEQVGDNDLMDLADVGLNSLYVADCKYLAKIAKELGKTSDHEELLKRELEFTNRVQELWVETTGLYLNKIIGQQKYSQRLSPTLFYPMLGGIPSRPQSSRMMKEHYYNPKEFYGEFIIPSIARNDKSFNNDYWQGAIWGPMNFLVYLGLRDYDKEAAGELAYRSYHLFLDSWKEHHYVFENINSAKGVASIDDNHLNCDPYYHWGALMGIMKFMEEGKYK